MRLLQIHTFPARLTPTQARAAHALEMQTRDLRLARTLASLHDAAGLPGGAAGYPPSRFDAASPAGLPSWYVPGTMSDTWQQPHEDGGDTYHDGGAPMTTSMVPSSQQLPAAPLLPSPGGGGGGATMVVERPSHAPSGLESRSTLMAPLHPNDRFRRGDSTLDGYSGGGGGGGGGYSGGGALMATASALGAPAAAGFADAPRGASRRGSTPERFAALAPAPSLDDRPEWRGVMQKDYSDSGRAPSSPGRAPSPSPGRAAAAAPPSSQRGHSPPMSPLPLAQLEQQQAADFEAARRRAEQRVVEAVARRRVESPTPRSPSPRGGGSPPLSSRGQQSSRRASSPRGSSPRGSRSPRASPRGSRSPRGSSPRKSGSPRGAKLKPRPAKPKAEAFRVVAK